MEGTAVDGWEAALACPWCRHGGLDRSGPDGPGPGGDTLRCPACGRVTHVVDGIWRAMGPARPARTAAQLVNALPLTARVYEDVWRTRSLGLLSRRPFPVFEELAELRDALGPVAGQRIADVACSEGLYARALTRAGAHVLAIDHSVAFLARVRARSLQAALSQRILPVQAVAQRLPFADGALDAAVMGGSLNEIGDAPAALAEMARVVRPGGRLFLMSLTPAPRPFGRLGQALARPSGIRFPSAAATRALVEAAGFAHLETRADGVVLRVCARRPPPR